MRFGLAPHSGTFLLDTGAAKQRADKSSALAEPKASMLAEFDRVNVPERPGNMGRLCYQTKAPGSVLIL